MVSHTDSFLSQPIQKLTLGCCDLVMHRSESNTHLSGNGAICRTFLSHHLVCRATGLWQAGECLVVQLRQFVCLLRVFRRHPFVIVLESFTSVFAVAGVVPLIPPKHAGALPLYHATYE